MSGTGGSLGRRRCGAGGLAEEDVAEVWALGHGGRRGGQPHLAAGHHVGPVGDGQRLVGVLLHQQDCQRRR